MTSRIDLHMHSTASDGTDAPFRLDFLRDRGITFPEEETDALRRFLSAGKPHLGNLMAKYGYAASRAEAIRDVINLCPTGSSRIPAGTAVGAILASGGIPVWAHPLGGEGEKAVGLEQFGAMLGDGYRRSLQDCVKKLDGILSEECSGELHEILRLSGDAGLVGAGTLLRKGIYPGPRHKVNVFPLAASEGEVYPDYIGFTCGSKAHQRTLLESADAYCWKACKALLDNPVCSYRSGLRERNPDGITHWFDLDKRICRKTSTDGTVLEEVTVSHLDIRRFAESVSGFSNLPLDKYIAEGCGGSAGYKAELFGKTFEWDNADFVFEAIEDAFNDLIWSL
ncbi:PHP domain-containing protein [uncultured Alistipes sp.]|uniref:PHP domain-containing protein n=1 Tax=uncultured Alistipes sp. TaxID=538949 RepID=UPI00272A1D98|nr:hypothetical protein [uncultured Alistipes sp.]